VAYKKIAIVLILVAVILAASLAFLKDKTIFSAQYKRCAQLVAQADQLFLNKKYSEAANKYRQALMIDPKNQKLWQKLFQTIEKETYAKVSTKIQPTEAPKAETQKLMPQEQKPQIPAKEEPSFVIEEDEGC